VEVDFDCVVVLVGVVCRIVLSWFMVDGRCFRNLGVN